MKQNANCTRYRLALGLALLLGGLLPATEGISEDDHPLKVVLLGTGTPISGAEQFGASILVEAGGNSYLFDCGRGCGIRLNQVYGVKEMHRADTLFLTHLHSDHTVGIPEVYLNGWIHGRAEPFRVFGPPRARQLMDGLRESYAADIDHRSYELEKFGYSSQIGGSEVDVNEVAEGLVLDEDGVKIFAFEVEHGHANPAFGYRVEYDNKIIVISGDTAPSKNLVRHARGVDVLIHEVMSPALLRAISRRYDNDPNITKFLVDVHTTAPDASEIFKQAQPRLAVYYHTPASEANTTELLDVTAKTYGGRVVVGQDLMTILVGDEIQVSDQRPPMSGNASTTRQ